MDYRRLSPAQRRIHAETTRGPHARRITLHLLTRDRKFVRSIADDRIVAAGLDWDTERTPVEVLTATVADVEGSLDWQRQEHRRLMLRVIDSRFIPGIGDEGTWVDEVSFTGPIWDHDRTGIETTLVAHSVEEQALGTVRRVMQWYAKDRLTKMIRELLMGAGANRDDLVIPNLRMTIPQRITVGVRVGTKRTKRKKGEKKRPQPMADTRYRMARATREDSYFGAAHEAAEAAGFNLYGRRDGRLVMERDQRRVSVRLGRGLLVEPIVEERAGDDSPNAFQVYGRNPKGPAKRIKSRLHVFPARHPLSGARLRWHNTPRLIIDVHENDKIGTEKQANRLARRRRNRALGLMVKRDVRAVPVSPRPKPGAMVHADDGHVVVKFRARQGAYPYTADATPMTLGAQSGEGWRR